MRKKRNHPGILLLVFFIAGTFIFMLAQFLFSSPSSEAKSVVDQFYTFEQDANFSASWNLFHPNMKEKFPKAAYIQDRTHVFMGHFGAETFSYEINEAEHLEEWRAAKGEKTFKTAYKFEVTQMYTGKYGKFSFIQEVYVVEQKKEWVILWNFNH
ncbi:hypothetical protein LC048_00015 [Mesobacillus subterraneus]|uniref:hypothetical protein n=1 Tax=Mesobacillus subterraneus TaxID=285983 RepID=UPI001CFD0EA8|nr:hypothetical protein [Mesobacillus subterraneus]WLR55450.1 hypothetical protein LC048_00015 [Mesobacillus subterraneus]